MERFARRSGLPSGTVDDAATRRVVRRDRIALAGVVLALPVGQFLLDQGLVFSAVAIGYVGLAVAALALGASSVLVGRAYLYGLMAGGERGVQRAADILAGEVRRTMALLGAATVRDLHPGMVELP